MLDNNNEGFDDYEIMEQEILNDSDSGEYISCVEPSLSGKQLCCFGRPVETERAVIGLGIFLMWIVIFFAGAGEFEEGSLEDFILRGSSIPMLIIYFKIVLGGKSKK